MRQVCLAVTNTVLIAPKVSVFVQSQTVGMRVARVSQELNTEARVGGTEMWKSPHYQLHSAPAHPDLWGYDFVQAKTFLINHRPPDLSLSSRLLSGSQETEPKTLADHGLGSILE